MKKDISINKTSLSKEDFWNNHINTVPKKFFEKYLYPDNYYKDLLSISQYCNKNQIKLIFWIPPTHVEFNAKIREYNLTEEKGIFKKDMISLGELYDYDYPNEITENKKYFKDPVHVNDETAATIRDEILHSKPLIAKHSKP